MAQQTAVEWLVEQTYKKEWYTIEKKIIIEQAKQMEKEQIEQAWGDGFDTAFISLNIANKYYNETYGK